MASGRRGRLKLAGLDRTGAPPEQTRPGEPLRPWTLPNAIGYLRMVLIGVFVWRSFESGDGRDAVAFWCFALAAAGDYLDGFVARVTGQYSRLGKLMDPLIDRALVVCGVVVCWHFELLPRWALAVLFARELFMVAVVAWGLARGLDLDVNMVGRVAVWFTMAGLGLSLAADSWVFTGALYVGIAGSIAATVLYVRDGLRQLSSQTG
jgi:cardiolipin synthase